MNEMEAYANNPKKSIDDLPGERCERACQLLRRIRALPADTYLYVRATDPQWAIDALEDLNATGHVWLIECGWTHDLCAFQRGTAVRR